VLGQNWSPSFVVCKSVPHVKIWMLDVLICSALCGRIQSSKTEIFSVFTFFTKIQYRLWWNWNWIPMKCLIIVSVQLFIKITESTVIHWDSRILILKTSSFEKVNQSRVNYFHQYQRYLHRCQWHRGYQWQIRTIMAVSGGTYKTNSGISPVRPLGAMLHVKY
jgi:hypothetical protein